MTSKAESSIGSNKDGFVSIGSDAGLSGPRGWESEVWRSVGSERELLSVIETEYEDDNDDDNDDDEDDNDDDDDDELDEVEG